MHVPIVRPIHSQLSHVISNIGHVLLEQTSFQLRMPASLHIALQCVRVIAHVARIRLDFVVKRSDVLFHAGDPFERFRAQRAREFPLVVVHLRVLVQCD